MHLSHFLRACLLMLALSVPASHAQEASSPTGAMEHGSYEILPTPLRTGDPSKIEVIEFFCYPLPVSQRVDALLTQAAGTWPANVVFKASPTGTKPMYLYAARLDYTLQAMQIEPQIRPLLFKSIVHDHLDFTRLSVLMAWLNAHGINGADFHKTFDSDDVMAETGNTGNVMALYHVTSVPTVVVNGRYLVTAGTAGGVDRIPAVVNVLIEKIQHDDPSSPH